MNGAAASRLASASYPPWVAGAAIAVVAAAGALAVVIAFPGEALLGLIGPGALVLLCLWMVATSRYELTLAVVALYIGLVDGYLRLKTGHWNLTIIRDLLFYSIVVGASARLIVRAEPIRLPPLAGWVFAFVALALVQVLNPAGPGVVKAVQALRPHLEWVPLFFLAYATLRTDGRLRGFLLILVVVAAINGVVGFLQFRLSPVELSDWGPGYAQRINGTGAVTSRVVLNQVTDTLQVRPFGLGADFGFAGALAILAAPAALALLGASRQRWLTLVVVPLSIAVVVGVATSESRTAVVATLISVTAYGALAAASRRFAGVLGGAAVAAVVTYVGVSMLVSGAVPGAFGHLSSIAPDQAVQTTVAYRADDLGYLRGYVYRFPFGAGLGSGGPAYTVTQGGEHPGLNAETELNFLVIELGVAGLLLFVAFSFKLIALATRTVRSIPGRDTRLFLAAICAPLFAQPAEWIAGTTTTTTPAAPGLWLAAGVLAFWATQTRFAPGTPAASHGSGHAGHGAPPQQTDFPRSGGPASANGLERDVPGTSARPAPNGKRGSHPALAAKNGAPERSPQSHFDGARRVLITAPWAERLGGAESMLYTLLKHLDRDRLNPNVVLLAEGPLERQLVALDVPTRTLPAGRLRHGRAFGRTVRALAGILQNEQPDLVLNWTPKAQLYGGPAAVRSGQTNRVVWWQHGIPHGHWMDRTATALPARAVGCSSERSAAAQRTMRPQRSVFVVHPGIDPPRPVSTSERQEVRRSLEMPAGALLLGIVGRLQPWKGQHRFLLALKELRSHADVRGVIVGGDAYGLSPRYEGELDRLIGELGLRDAVTRTGHVADPNPLMGALDILVNASDEEPFGLVLLEAMALGVPVVAVASGGPLEIVGNGPCAALAASSEPPDLVRAIEPLLGDPGLRTSLAEEGRRRFDTAFTAETAARRFEDALLALCARRRR